MTHVRTEVRLWKRQAGVYVRKAYDDSTYRRPPQAVAAATNHCHSGKVRSWKNAGRGYAIVGGEVEYTPLYYTSPHNYGCSDNS
ncbi:MAG TPA: hypothetical protein VGM93_13075 [Acidimicrobiales bacterium]